jgi:hypothetical protein
MPRRDPAEARAYAGSQRWGRFSVQLQSNSRGWLHRVIPRKRHQMRHSCNLACFIAKHALSKTGVHVKTWLQLGSNCYRNRYKTQYHDTKPNEPARWLFLLGLGKHVVLRPIAFTGGNFGGKTRHQFVTETLSFRDIFAMVRTGNAKQAKRFSFLTTQLTRWRPAVRARTDLPYFSILPGWPLPSGVVLRRGLRDTYF